MKERKGMLLLDALIGLLLLSSLAAALFPLLGQGVYILDETAKRGRLVGEGLYAMDFMGEQVRNNLDTGQTDFLSSNRYTYKTYDERNRISPYTLYIDKEKLYIQLYTGRTEPVTGESSGKVEAFAFQTQEGKSLFTRQGTGPLHMAFQLFHQMSGNRWEGETSMIPYADYYRKGNVYE